MAVKKMSWRRSNQALSLLLVLVPTYLFSMDKEEDDRTLPVYSVRQTELQDRVFNAAPKFAQNLVRHLKDPEELGVPHMRGVLFVGEPGSGKTTTGYAIARKAGWHPELILPDHVRCGRRSETSLNLKNKLDDLTEYADKTLIICDEMDNLFANPEKESDDTKETATGFWQWFDAIKEHPNRNEIFFIGITNEHRYLPRPFKSRFSGKMLTFTGCTTPREKAEALMWHLKGYTNVNSDVDLKLLKGGFKQCPQFNGRDFEVLSDTAKLYATIDRKNAPLTRDNVVQSFESLAQERVDNLYYREEMTEAQRQDKYHSESKMMHAISIATGVVGTGFTIARKMAIGF
jgi:AAA+ superfamily predicted ATPase